MIAAETNVEIVALSVTVQTPPPRRSGVMSRIPPSSDTRLPNVGSHVTISSRRSGSQIADERNPLPEPAEQYRRTAGESPLPGYTLLRPLGRGGFGEVWKCEAPGGLLKAIKFVKGSDDSNPRGGHQLRQEYEAFEQVKAIRHPFLLCLERVELVDDELVMVMGLADRHIGELFSECRAGGLPGIPRDELIAYLREAAEALDVISAQYGLQHLDVKPANLFLTAGHLQVGDYGLVSKLDGGTGSGKNRGLTPKYAAPEVLKGTVHTQSDQYSLALVYQELLTGYFPYTGRSPQQMMMQHVTAVPELGSLPRFDRGPVAKALSKSPEDRFASCLDFIDALGPTDPRATRRSSAIQPQSRPRSQSASSSGESVGPAPPAPMVEAKLRLSEIRSVIPTRQLLGHRTPPSNRRPEAVIEAVVAYAAEAGITPARGGDERAEDGTWSCRFLTTVSPRLAKVKLELVWEEGGLTMDARDDNRVIFRKIAPAFRLFGSREPAGLEIVIELPENAGEVGEVGVSAKLFGTVKPDFVKGAERLVPQVISGIRRVLNNVGERRKHPRLPAEFQFDVIAVHSDGTLDEPVEALCLDVSSGGLAFRLARPPTCKYIYAAFDRIAGTEGLALLVQTIKIHTDDTGVNVTGRYRTDL